MKYRVLIEIEYAPKHSHKTEIFGESDRISEDLGIALAGVIQGACVYDEPWPSEIVAFLLWRMDHHSDCLNAMGEIAHAWWIGKSQEKRLDEVCEVVALKEFMKDPNYATPMDALPGSQERQPSS